MPGIMMVLAGLSHGLNATTVRRLALIVEAMLSMTCPVAMLCIFDAVSFEVDAVSSRSAIRHEPSLSKPRAAC